MPLLLSGPAGAGKSQEAQRLLEEAEEPTVVVDFQSILAALLQLSRDPDTGRYPPRDESEQYAVDLTSYMRSTAIRQAIENGDDVIATNSSGDPVVRNRLLALLSAGAAQATERIIDPGRDQVVARLSVNGELTEQCASAISRWYDNLPADESRELEFRVSGDVVYSLIEVRQDGNTFYGTILQEGVAATGGRREVFAPQSVEWPEGGIDILDNHRGNSLGKAIPSRDSRGRLTVSMRATDAVKRALAAGKRFMSVEFKSMAETTTRGGVRQLDRARVLAAALVANPEYSQTSAEVRSQRRRGPWL